MIRLINVFVFAAILAFMGVSCQHGQRPVESASLDSNGSIAGRLEPGAIGDFVWHDENMDGI